MKKKWCTVLLILGLILCQLPAGSALAGQTGEGTAAAETETLAEPENGSGESADSAAVLKDGAAAAGEGTDTAAEETEETEEAADETAVAAESAAVDASDPDDNAAAEADGTGTAKDESAAVDPDASAVEEADGTGTAKDESAAVDPDASAVEEADETGEEELLAIVNLKKVAENNVNEAKKVLLLASTVLATIPSATIDVKVPAAGSKDVMAQDIVSVPAGSHYSVQSAYWVGSAADGGVVLSLYSDYCYPEGLQAGKNYALTVTLTAEDGYVFEQGVSTYTVTGSGAQVNGSKEIFCRTGLDTDDEGSCNILITPEEAIPEAITEVAVSVTAPSAGDSAADVAACISVPADANYSLIPYVSCYDQLPEYDDFGNPVTAEFTGTFEEGKTYYLDIRVYANPGYMFRQASPGTSVAVSGADLVIESGLLVTNVWSEAGDPMSYGNTVVSFTAADTVSLTLHWSSIDGTDLEEPIVIRGIEKGTEFGEIEEAGGKPFSREGYVYSGYCMPEPITGYSDPLELWSKSLAANEAIEKDTDVYYIYMKWIETADLSIEQPKAGTSTSYSSSSDTQTNPPVVTVLGSHYGPDTEYDLPTAWVNASGSAPFEGTFEAGQEYYAVIFLAADFGYYFDPEIDVQVENAVTEAREVDSYRLYEMGVIAKTQAVRTARQTFIDKTVDKSKSYVTGVVHITGNKGTADGYNPGKTVYSENADVSYSTPKPASVETMIGEARDLADGLAAKCKKEGDSGEYHMSVGTSTGKVWDDRTYALYEWNGSAWEDGNGETYTGSDAPKSPETGDILLVAAGEYGKLTYYRVEANGWVHKHEMTKTERLDPTCTEPGTEAYWTCSDCGKLFSDAAGTEEITEPVVIAALGHDWGDWVVTREPTEKEAGLEVRTCKNDPSHTESRELDMLQISYRNTSGDGGKYEKGSGQTLSFTFKRSVGDQETFDHFTGVKADGKELDAASYTAASGSVVITLKTDCLDSLAAGNHTLTALFEDGNDVTVSFTVSEKEKEPASEEPASGDSTDTGSKTEAASAKSVPTGDGGRPALWGMLMAASLLALFTVYRKRKA